MAISAQSFAIALGYYSIAAFASFLFFGIVRRIRPFSKFYSPRCFSKEKGLLVPPRLPLPLLGWILPVSSFTQLTIFEFGGVDGLMMLRTLYFGLHMFCWLSIVCCAILLPVNLTGGEVDNLKNEDPNYSFSNLDRMSLTNVAPGSARLYAHVVVSYVCTAIVFVLLWHHTRVSIAVRLAYLQMREVGENAHTVLVQDVPGLVAGTRTHRIGVGWLVCLPRAWRRERASTMLERQAGVVEQLQAAFAWMSSLFGRSILGLLHLLHTCTERLRRCFGRSSSETPFIMPGMPGVIYGPRKPSSDGGGDVQADGAAGVRDGAKAWAARDAGGRSLSARVAELTTSSSLGRRKGPAGRRGSDDSAIAGLLEPAGLSAWPDATAKLAAGASPEQLVHQEFTTVYGPATSAVVLVHDTYTLRPLANQYRKVSMKLRDALDEYAARSARGLPITIPQVTVWPAKYGDWGKTKFGDRRRARVNFVRFSAEWLDQLRTRMLEQQRTAARLPTPSAFVTFRSRRTAVVAASALMHHDTNAWRCSAAPPPKDIIWTNLRYRQWERTARRVVVLMLYIVLAFTYYIPVNAVQAMLAAEDWVGWLSANPLIGALYEAVIPGLALKMFVWTLPIWLSLIMSLGGMISRVRRDLELMSTFYCFQVLVVLFGSFVGSSWAANLRELLESAAGVLDTVGASAPQTATFFLNYIALQALLAAPLNWLRLPQFFIFSSRVWFSYSEAARRRIWASRDVRYSANVAWITFSMALALVFCPVLPVIAPAGLLLLMMQTVMWKYDLVYVYKQEVSGGGLLWRHVFWHMVSALWCQHIILASIIAIKRNVPAALMMIGPVLATIVFSVVVERRFHTPAKTMSLRNAVDLDSSEGQPGAGATVTTHAGGVAGATHSSHADGAASAMNGGIVKGAQADAAASGETHSVGADVGAQPPGSAPSTSSRGERTSVLLLPGKGHGSGCGSTGPRSGRGGDGSGDAAQGRGSGSSGSGRGGDSSGDVAQGRASHGESSDGGARGGSTQCAEERAPEVVVVVSGPGDGGSGSRVNCATQVQPSPASASATDMLPPESSLGTVADGGAALRYIDPALQFDEAVHAQLLSEATYWLERTEPGTAAAASSKGGKVAEMTSQNGSISSLVRPSMSGGKDREAGSVPDEREDDEVGDGGSSKPAQYA